MNPAMAAAVRAARDNAADGSAAITPAPVLKAEFPDIIEIAGRTFLPFRLNTLRALQAVKSPIVAAAMGSEQTPLTDLDGLIAFWIFTTELPVVRETIGRGMDAVRGAAETLGDSLELGDQFKLGKAIGLHVQSGFVTVIAAAEKDPDLKKALHAAIQSAATTASAPAPLAKRALATDSDGRSATKSGS